MESRTSAAAVGVRGVMLHLKGTGCLFKTKWILALSALVLNVIFPYVSTPLVNSGLSLMTFPWSSTGGLMSKAARIQDAIKYNELSLKCLPGQIL